MREQSVHTDLVVTLPLAKWATWSKGGGWGGGGLKEGSPRAPRPATFPAPAPRPAAWLVSPRQVSGLAQTGTAVTKTWTQSPIPSALRSSGHHLLSLVSVSLAVKEENLPPPWEDSMSAECQTPNRGLTCEPPSRLPAGTRLCWKTFTDPGTAAEARIQSQAKGLSTWELGAQTEGLEGWEGEGPEGGPPPGGPRGDFVQAPSLAEIAGLSALTVGVQRGRSTQRKPQPRGAGPRTW